MLSLQIIYIAANLMIQTQVSLINDFIGNGARDHFLTYKESYPIGILGQNRLHSIMRD